MWEAIKNFILSALSDPGIIHAYEKASQFGSATSFFLRKHMSAEFEAANVWYSNVKAYYAAHSPESQQNAEPVFEPTDLDILTNHHLSSPVKFCEPLEDSATFITYEELDEYIETNSVPNPGPHEFFLYKWDPFMVDSVEDYKRRNIDEENLEMHKNLETSWYEGFKNGKHDYLLPTDYWIWDKFATSYTKEHKRYLAFIKEDALMYKNYYARFKEKEKDHNFNIIEKEQHYINLCNWENYSYNYHKFMSRFMRLKEQESYIKKIVTEKVVFNFEKKLKPVKRLSIDSSERWSIKY